MKFLACVFVLALPATAFAQSPTPRILATGEYTQSRNDTAAAAKALARLDADRNAIDRAVADLRARPEVMALQLTAAQIAAYAAATLDPQEQSARTPVVQNRTVHQVDVAVVLDADALRRFSVVRKDRNASATLLKISADIQELRSKVAEQTARLDRSSGSDSAAIAQERQAALTKLRLAQLTARITAGLALTEESPFSRRVSSSEGQQRARQSADEAMAIGPDSADAHYGLGDVLMEQEEVEAAEAEYRKGLAANPAFGPGHQKLGDALRLQRKFDDAIAEFREAIRLDPKDSRNHSDLALTFNTQRSTTDAIAEYQEAIRLNPDDVDAHNGLAVVFAGQERMPAAAAEFREIVRIDPDLVIGHYNLAHALADMDMDAESAAELREVVRLNPNHYNAHFDLGDLFRIEGKFDDAARQFKEYLRLAPDTPQTQRNRRRAQTLVQSYEQPAGR